MHLLYYTPILLEGREADELQLPAFCLWEEKQGAESAGEKGGGGTAIEGRGGKGNHCSRTKKPSADVDKGMHNPLTGGRLQEPRI